MSRLREHPVLSVGATLAVILLLVFFGYAVYLAGVAGELPWQTDPTRIPVTPFSGFSAPTPLPTAAP